MKESQIITNKGQIIAQIAEKRTSAATWMEDWHILCVSAAIHVNKHGDYRLLNHFLKVNKGVNRTAMKEFFKANAPVNFTSEGGIDDTIYVKENRLDLDKLAAMPEDSTEYAQYKEYMTELLTKPWHEYKAPKKVNPLDLKKALATLATRAHKQVTDKVEGREIDPMTLAAVDQLAKTGRIDVHQVAQEMGFMLVPIKQLEVVEEIELTTVNGE